LVFSWGKNQLSNMAKDESPFETAPFFCVCPVYINVKDNSLLKKTDQISEKLCVAMKCTSGDGQFALKYWYDESVMSQTFRK
jgi:hypothetical protein